MKITTTPLKLFTQLLRDYLKFNRTASERTACDAVMPTLRSKLGEAMALQAYRHPLRHDIYLQLKSEINN